jgi:hypothetical protein
MASEICKLISIITERTAIKMEVGYVSQTAGVLITQTSNSNEESIKTDDKHFLVAYDTNLQTCNRN